MGAGAMFGLFAISKKKDADARCPAKSCDDIGFDAQRTAHTDATISTIAFATGAAGLALSSVLALTARRAPAPSAIRVVPLVAVGGGHVRIEGAF
jgi:hypothetical protein